MNKRINIALLGRDFISWGGGLDFLRFCANALVVRSQTHPINIFLLIPQDIGIMGEIKSIVRPFKNMAKSILKLKKPQYIRQNLFDKKQIEDSFKNINGEIQIVFYNNNHKALINSLFQIHADVVLPAGSALGSTFPIPWVGYIYDFQHKYYPEFFSAEECIIRDHSFESILTETNAVIVNAKAVKNDIIKFFPNTSCNVFNLPFAPVPVDNWFDEPAFDLASKYNLPKKYFIISNQFWVHKSHLTAFEALSKIQHEDGMNNIEIVCTGKTEDYRYPDYFDELKKKVVSLGISNKVHFLGHIPKKDQIQIMRNAIAVLQPTLFEGGPGGGAIYDAVALGVPALVSDIPVNLEIDEENVKFFKAGSADDLVLKMRDLLKCNFIKQEKKLLIDNGKKRTELFGDTLLKAIDFVLENK